MTLAIALSWRKLAFTAELLGLSNLKAKLPKRAKSFLPRGLTHSYRDPKDPLSLVWLCQTESKKCFCHLAFNKLLACKKWVPKYTVSSNQKVKEIKVEEKKNWCVQKEGENVVPSTLYSICFKEKQHCKRIAIYLWVSNACCLYNILVLSQCNHSGRWTFYSFYVDLLDNYISKYESTR